MISRLFDLFISALIALMVYAFCCYVRVPENISGFIAGCIFMCIMAVLQGNVLKNDGDEEA